MSIEDRDIRRLYLLTPNNPEPLLARIIDKCLSNPQFSDATRGRIVVETLQVLHETWKQPGEMGHLFISTCMLSQDKTTANYAAEIWVKAVEENSINNDLLGTLLGKTQSIEFAPMKRLTDLILKNMLNISPLHNTALQAMLTAFLREQPESPIRGFRKLLEIYFELLHVNCSSVLDASLNSKMQHWKGSGTLSKVIKDVIVQ